MMYVGNMQERERNSHQYLLSKNLVGSECPDKIMGTWDSTNDECTVHEIENKETHILQRPSK